jgi:hypothetical protein
VDTKKAEKLYLMASFPHASAEEFVLGCFEDLTMEEVSEIEDRFLEELPHSLDPFPCLWIEPETRLLGDSKRSVNVASMWAAIEDDLKEGDYGPYLFDMRFWSAYRVRKLAGDVRYERDQKRLVAALGQDLFQVCHGNTRFDLQIFDKTGTHRWGPVETPSFWGCTQTEETLYRHPRGEWTLIVGSLELAGTVPGSAAAHRLSDVQAVRWLTHHKFDLPEDMQDLAKLEFYRPEAAPISSKEWVTPAGEDVGKLIRKLIAQEVGPDAPHWDPQRRELRYRGTLCKQYRQSAVNQTRILDAFQEAGWPNRIDDPIPPQRGSDHRQRVADAVRGLNHQNDCVRFELDGTREGILWTARE